MKSSKNNYERFLVLYHQNERKIFVYIYGLVSIRSIADDLMQETMIVMWQKFSDYKEGTSFTSWGIAISHFLIMEYYRKEKKSIVRFSSEAINSLQEVSGSFEDYDSRAEALQNCLKKLPADALRIIAWRYRDCMKIKDIAEKIKKPLQGMYKRISKLHFILHECIENQLVAWGEGRE